MVNDVFVECTGIQTPIGLHALYVGPICMHACVDCIELMFCLKYQWPWCPAYWPRCPLINNL